MADVQCVTCGQTGEAITDMLFLGKLEAEVKGQGLQTLLEEVGGDAGHGHQRIPDQSGR
jgi:hypothetical protein